MTRPIVKQASRFTETAIEDEIVLLNLDTGDFFSLGDSARAIWELIDGTRTRDAIVSELARTFGENPALAPDVDAFLAQLSAERLIGL